MGTVTCTACDGVGWIVPDDALEPGKPDGVDCTACNGDGFVYA